MKFILIVAAALLAAAFVYSRFQKRRDDASNVSHDIPYGPFIIRVTARTGSNFNMNYGMVKYTSVSYFVLYNGQPVAFPGALESNTGLPYMWNVYALPDAPDPTLIAGSQSLYMIYLKNGQPVAEPLLQQGSDFASLQLLDSENGQPGKYFEVYSKNETEHIDRLDSLTGGSLLMIGEKAVLDIKTRKLMPFHVDNRSIDNYSFPMPHGAKALSKDKKELVFHANFDSWNSSDEDLPESEHALAVYNYEKDSGYIVKYDDTDTRMINLEEVNRDWINTYFVWKKEPGSGERLMLRTLDKRPYWTGRLGKDNYFILYPVKPGILPVFRDFVLAQMGWNQSNIAKDETGEYTGRKINLVSGDTQLDITLYEDDRKMAFSKGLYKDESPEYKALVQKISDAFNAELAAGKYQEHFDRVINETKRIRGN